MTKYYFLDFSSFFSKSFFICSRESLFFSIASFSDFRSETKSLSVFNSCSKSEICFSFSEILSSIKCSLCSNSQIALVKISLISQIFSKGFTSFLSSFSIETDSEKLHKSTKLSSEVSHFFSSVRSKSSKELSIFSDSSDFSVSQAETSFDKSLREIFAELVVSKGSSAFTGVSSSSKVKEKSSSKSFLFVLAC